jgi:hypothetical protein
MTARNEKVIERAHQSSPRIALAGRDWRIAAHPYLKSRRRATQLERSSHSHALLPSCKVAQSFTFVQGRPKLLKLAYECKLNDTARMSPRANVSDVHLRETVGNK